MTDQAGFVFEGPLTEMPASQLPPRREPNERERALLKLDRGELIALLRSVAKDLPDEIGYDDALVSAGLQTHSLTGWHRACAMDALLPPEGEYQAYLPEPGRVRFKRLYPCPGFDGEPCPARALTGGGEMCPRCRDIEEEDLYNAD